MNSKANFKDLLLIAANELKDLTTVENPDFRLEQAEYNETTKEWDIIVSFLVQNTNLRKTVFEIPSFSLEYERIYKRLKINSQKEVMGLYIFEN
ncbi:hypothetical protein A33Q_1904 [Indibacter alkaliphilus LW1]|uniref:Uncharacterized protein n=1 Tax=Indibacter alkaliphilus (strain CCUG 57479 / KCTC 22604 / LW1) TaxID=1189612 RepID=S2DXX3_INDAL|nr:hypothetical protein [Indibacter alkaliphilus]EOZ96986.1 hypothetical protein A33Q_1904 [Indibacter alkaliphilus LW1]